MHGKTRKEYSESGGRNKAEQIKFQKNFNK